MPSIRFDQGDTGTVDRSRSDIVVGVEVDVFALGVVGTAIFGLLDRPPGSAAVFAGAGGDRQITPDVAGPYRVRIIDDNDGSEVRHTFTVRTALLGLDLPASNETANAAANDVENNAADILASESNEGGTFKGWHPKANAALLLLEAAIGARATKTTGVVDLYVRTVGGNDAFPGTSALPLATLPAAIAKIPDLIADAVLIHLGDGAYTAANITGRVLSAPFFIVGDGATVGDGFTVVQAAELADVGTSATQIVKVGGGLTPDAHRGETIEITDGAGVGQRFHIKKNTASVYTFSKGAATVALDNTSEYRVVRPAVTVDYDTDILYSLSAGPSLGALALVPFAPKFGFAQVEFTDSALTIADFAADTVFYGVNLGGTNGSNVRALANQCWGCENIFGLGRLPVELFGAAANADWLGWGLASIGASTMNVAAQEAVQTGNIVLNTPMVVGQATTLNIAGGRIVVSEGSAAFLGTAGSRSVLAQLSVENTGAGPAVRADDFSYIDGPSLNTETAAGAMLESADRGNISIASANWTGSSSAGLAARALAGSILFAGAPAVDGFVPGSDYAIGIATPTLVGKAAFAALGDGASASDQSAMTRVF